MYGYCRHHWHQGWHCHEPGGYYEAPFRRFSSADDISRLEEHIKYLQSETRDLEKRLAEMKASA